MGFACSFHGISPKSLGESTPTSKGQVHNWIDISEKVPYFGNVYVFYSRLASVLSSLLFGMWPLAIHAPLPPFLSRVS